MLGLRINTVRRYNRRCSPPLRMSTRLLNVSGGNRNFVRYDVADMVLPSDVRTSSAISVTVSRIVCPGLNVMPCWR